MCNASLQRGTLPTTQRSAIVAPRLKKTGSDPADVRNYRPISNLTFMSKVVECLVCRQLVAYLEQNGLLPDLVYIQALSVDWDWRSQGHRQPPHSSKSRQSYTSQCARSIHCFWHCWSWHLYRQTISCFWFSWWCTVMDYQLRHWSYTKGPCRKPVLEVLCSPVRCTTVQCPCTLLMCWSSLHVTASVSTRTLMTLSCTYIHRPLTVKQRLHAW